MYFCAAMYRGKNTCKILKEIRQRIADENDIALITDECHYQGDCTGTCPRCESELRYLEEELRKRLRLGKAVTLAGLSLGIATATAGCAAHREDVVLPGIVLEMEENVQRANDSSIEGMDFVTDTSSRKLDFFSEQLENADTLVPPIMGTIELPSEYPGGVEALMAFLEKETHYPASALADSIQGTVIVEFVVKEDGYLADPKVKVSLSPDCDAEALRVIRAMPRWKVEEYKGESKKMFYQVPVKFVLPEQ